MGHPRPSSEMALRWRADDGPLLVEFGSSLPSINTIFWSLFLIIELQSHFLDIIVLQADMSYILWKNRFLLD